MGGVSAFPGHADQPGGMVAGMLPRRAVLTAAGLLVLAGAVAVTWPRGGAPAPEPGPVAPVAETFRPDPRLHPPADPPRGDVEHLPLAP